MTEIFAAYRHTCDPCLDKATGQRIPNCTASYCTDQRFTWAPQPEPPKVDDPMTLDVENGPEYNAWLFERSYRDGVTGYYDQLTGPGAIDADERRLIS